MKTDWPIPHNPERLALDPGYRFLSKDEPRRETDELWSPGGWRSIKLRQAYLLDPRIHSVWTVRRALNIDDPMAPPPEEWVKEGYVIEYPGFDTSARYTDVWVLRPPGTPGGYWYPVTPKSITSGGHYYRREVNRVLGRHVSSGVNPETTPPLKPNQSIIVFVGDSQPLSKAVQEIAFAMGRGSGCTNTHCLWHGEDSIAIRPFNDPLRRIQTGNRETWHRQEPDAVYLDARTDMGKLIDLLKTPVKVAPVGPTINGYVGVYAKDDPVITFGCAQISVAMLVCAKTMKKNTGYWPGNRTVADIGLSSGVRLTEDQIASIINYVNEVNAQP